MKLIAPFPYYGGKSRVSEIVWSRFGNVDHYIEPFGGSLAVLLQRPSFHDIKIETVGDINGFLANFWRVLKRYPSELALSCEGPRFEVDTAAERKFLILQENDLTEQLKLDKDFCDLEMATFWIRGLCASIGSGYPWSNSDGTRPQLHTGEGIYSMSRRDNLPNVFQELSERLKHVRICYTSWERLLSPTVLGGKTGNLVSGVFLDPPYTDLAGRQDNLYGNKDSLSVGYLTHEWCLENGDNPNLRIALCGYEGEYDIPDTWETFEWTTSGGMGNTSLADTRGKDNSTKERVWFSPHCLKPNQHNFLGQFILEDS